MYYITMWVDPTMLSIIISLYLSCEQPNFLHFFFSPVRIRIYVAVAAVDDCLSAEGVGFAHLHERFAK